MSLFSYIQENIRDSLVARITVCRMVDRGSIPRRGVFFFFLCNLYAVPVQISFNSSLLSRFFLLRLLRALNVPHYTAVCSQTSLLEFMLSARGARIKLVKFVTQRAFSVSFMSH